MGKPLGARRASRAAGHCRVVWRTMLIRSVDVPRALIEAHRNGRLVIFVGAGASRDAPRSARLSSACC